MEKRSCYSIILYTILSIFLPVPGKALSGDIGVHDPSSIVKEGDKYWLFSTGNGINACYSSDLISWKKAQNTVFTNGYWPSWINQYVPEFAGAFWAPDIIQMNGRYYLYYTCSTISSPVSVIGVATSPTLDQQSPAYHWEDLGLVVSSSSYRDVNAIDPSVFKDDNGRLYLTYGSYHEGIGVIELDAGTGKAKPGASVNTVAGGNGSAWEAPCLIKEGSYYYLIANKAYCCTGTSSTYYMVTGRSTSPTGPFADKNGIDLKENFSIGAGTPVMVTTGRYIGPGHFALLKDNGRNIVSMHYYDREDIGNPKLDIAALEFSADGWPVITRNYLNPGRYTISSAQSKMTWQLGGCIGNNGAQVSVSAAINNSCEEWNLTPVGDGYYKISNDEKNFTIDVPGCNSANGMNLQGWSWLNNDCQKFKVELSANGNYVFTSASIRTGARVIQAVSPAAGQGSILSLYDYNGTASQQWIVKEVSKPGLGGVTNITDSGFALHWAGRPNAVYRLDIMSSIDDAAGETLAGWSFETGSNKANSGVAVNIGKQVATVGTDKAVFNASGNGGKTGQASGWQYSGADKYWEIELSTENFYHIQLSSRQRSTITGPRHFKLQYKIGAGGTYADVPTGFVSILDNYTAGVLDNVLLPHQCDNQPSVFVRWLLISRASLKDASIETDGRSNIDDILITGNRGDYIAGYNNTLINDTVVRVTALTPGSDFYCRIREVIGGYTSQNSDIIKASTTGTPPLEFSYLHAAGDKGDVQVEWRVTPEKSNVRYELERSANGQLFTQIASIAGKNLLKSTGSYSYLDLHPVLSNNYYRVKAILATGIAKYSSTVKVYREKGNNGSFFYPNPCDGKSTNLQLFDGAAGVNTIKLLTSSGQVVFKTQFRHAGGSTKLPIMLPNLANGIYYFSVTNEKSKSAQTIFVGNP